MWQFINVAASLNFRFVATSVMDIDFLSVDINQCPIGIGNEAPNFFAGTAKCKDTTMVSIFPKNALFYRD